MPIFFVDFTGLSRKHVYSAVNEIGVLICSEGIYSRPQNILWVNMVFSFLVVVCMCRVAMHFSVSRANTLGATSCVPVGTDRTFADCVSRTVASGFVPRTLYFLIGSV